MSESGRSRSRPKTYQTHVHDLLMDESAKAFRHDNKQDQRNGVTVPSLEGEKKGEGWPLTRTDKEGEDTS